MVHDIFGELNLLKTIKLNWFRLITLIIDNQGQEREREREGEERRGREATQNENDTLR